MNTSLQCPTCNASGTQPCRTWRGADFLDGFRHDDRDKRVKLTKDERRGLASVFSLISVLCGGKPNKNAWRGLPCEAKRKRNGQPICGRGATTVRNFEAAPGMWVHVMLCHRHGYVWDQADGWGGGIPYRELACNGGCPKGECRGESDGPRFHLWFTEDEIDDLHGALNHTFDEDSYQFSRCGRDGIRNMNTQLKSALREANKQVIAAK